MFADLNGLVAEWLGSGLQTVYSGSNPLEIPLNRSSSVAFSYWSYSSKKMTKFVGMIFKMTYPMRKVLIFIFFVSCFKLFAQMPASYGTSRATNNINSEVISRFLFGSETLQRLFLVSCYSKWRHRYN